MQHSEAFEALCRDARDRVQECTVDQVKGWLDENAAFHLLDVREESEFAAGHIGRSEHLGRGIIERDIEARVPDYGARIILYCGGGYRSALAADNLQKIGYTNVLSMWGGFRGWKEAGLPVES